MNIFYPLYVGLSSDGILTDVVAVVSGSPPCVSRTQPDAVDSCLPAQLLSNHPLR